MSNTNKILQILIIAFALVAGFLIGNYTRQTNSPTSTINQQVQLFEKKRECADMREQAIKQMNETYKVAAPYFYEIFYSPKTDSCLYDYGILLTGTSPNEVGSFILDDLFSGKTIINAQYDNSSPDTNKQSPTIREKWSKAVDIYRP